MQPWMKWLLLAVFLTAMGVIQFIPVNDEATEASSNTPVDGGAAGSRADSLRDQTGQSATASSTGAADASATDS